MDRARYRTGAKPPHRRAAKL